MTEPCQTTDIAIVGSGMVGTPLALVLASQGLSVTLLDADDRVTRDVNTELNQRCTAVSAGSVQLLQSIGLWDYVANDACPIKSVHVSQRGYFGSVRMQAKQHQLDALGYVLNNDGYLQALQGVLADSSVIQIKGARASSYETTASHALVGYQTKHSKASVMAKLVIAVDGVASAMREAVGIGTKAYDYEQSVVLGCVEHERPNNNIAYERFTAGGPLALLPRTDTISSFVYCIDAKHQSEVSSLDASAFLHRLQQEFGHRLGAFTQIGERVVFPLTRIEAQQPLHGRLLLLGNALRLVHPVAGQGYNLAMRDIASLSSLLNGAGKSDPGNAQLLQDYVASRESDHQRVTRLTDTLARSFRGYASLPGHLRGAGLLGLAAVPLLSREFTRQGLGLDVSARLAR
jgi:2-octaprenyl-6-methoxyphenol hydroxylase